jgi:AcrR family transcriptional regulator
VDAEGGPSGALQAAMDVFLASGFHAARVEDLEAATGETWHRLVERFRDKEGLFFAATEERLTALASGGAKDDGSLAAIATMLRGVQAASVNTRLRVVHKAALQRLLRLAEACAAADNGGS